MNINGCVNVKSLNHYTEKYSKGKKKRRKREYKMTEQILDVNGKQTNKERRRENKKAKKKYLWEYKLKHPCEICQETHPICLTFHHRDKTKKDNDVASLLNNSWKKLKDEIAKCQILCENCHKKLHYNEINNNNNNNNGHKK